MFDTSQINAERQKIFIVGNSRSGTTLMGRILGRHPHIFTFHELHFFEQLWNPVMNPELLHREQAIQLTARLLSIQQDGYFSQGNPQNYMLEAEDVLISFKDDNFYPPKVFDEFLAHESDKFGKSIACDQTPRNVYYIEEILNLYPRAFFINMIRDPRDVLLSQRNKWRRRLLGGKSIPRAEMIRSWVNYHPITISMLWNSGINAGDKYVDHHRVYQLRFEDLIVSPEAMIREVCVFLDLPYDSGMLDVPQIGSSHEVDKPEIVGINPHAAGRWYEEKSNQAEYGVCQWITKNNLLRHKYIQEDIEISYFSRFWILITWPLKIGMAFLMNIGRTKNLIIALKKRF
jgi:hypothetical protein